MATKPEEVIEFHQRPKLELLTYEKPEEEEEEELPLWVRRVIYDSVRSALEKTDGIATTASETYVTAQRDPIQETEKTSRLELWAKSVSGPYKANCDPNNVSEKTYRGHITYEEMGSISAHIIRRK